MQISRVFEGVGIALDSLRANKVRAALTILGVAIGVMVVIAMASIGHRHQPWRGEGAGEPRPEDVHREPVLPGRAQHLRWLR